MSATEEISNSLESFEEKIKELSSEESPPDDSSSDKEESSRKRQRTVKRVSEEDPDTQVLVSFVVIPMEGCDSDIFEVTTTIGHLKEIDNLLNFVTSSDYIGDGSDILVLLDPETEISDWKTFEEDDWLHCKLTKDKLESMEDYLGEEKFKEYFTHTKPIDLKQRKVHYQQSPRNAVTRVVFDYH